MTRTERNSRITRVERAAAREKMTRTSSRRRTFNLSKEAKALTTIAAIVFAIIFVIVGVEAYKATLQYKNNTLNNEIAYLQAEIDSMNSQIVEETKVTSIEKTATEKYDMVYPTAENCVTLHTNNKKNNNNLAAKIRKKAYN